MRRTTTPQLPMLTVHNVQSSTSPTAQRRAPRPRCGRSSDKSTPSNPNHRISGSRPQPPCTVRRPRQWHRVFTTALVMS